MPPCLDQPLLSFPVLSPVRYPLFLWGRNPILYIAFKRRPPSPCLGKNPAGEFGDGGVQNFEFLISAGNLLTLNEENPCLEQAVLV